MKTMISLDSEVHRKAKSFAAREGYSLSRLVEEGLRLRMTANPSRPRKAVSALPVFRGKGGLRPGVDLSDGRSVQQALEGGAPLRALR